MARHSRFTPKSTPRGWCVNVPPKFTASGKRERQYFKSRALAEAAAKALKERKAAFGEEATIISPTLAAQATEAQRILEPMDVSLVQAARFYADHIERLQASAPLAAALEQFRAAKEGRSAKQVQNYRLMAEDLTADFPERTLSSITGEELDAHVARHTNGPAGHNQRLRLLSAFWRWAAKKPRGWCDPAELEAIEKQETSSGVIGTLTPAEARALLATAEEHYPDCALAFAVLLFTGIRRQELERLDPSDFTADGITVPAASAKTKRRRFIHMPEPLVAWLKAYPVAQTVLPSDWQRKHKAVRRLAGWRIWSDLVKPPAPPDDLPSWPANALRHTAASVALARGKPIETLVFEHGHSGGLQTLRNHYIGVVSKKDAEAIWNIKPRAGKRR